MKIRMTKTSSIIILSGTISCLETVNAFTAPAASIRNSIDISSSSIRSATGDFIPPVAGGLNLTKGSPFGENYNELYGREDDDDLADRLGLKKHVNIVNSGEMPLLASTVGHVEAILKVSEEAAAVAEASLPKNVLASIPSIPVSINSTIGVVDENSSISSSSKVSENVSVKKNYVLDKFDFPSVKRILVFATSATGVFLCGPLLSLIDTSSVGLLSGTAQQAALNPAVAVTDYAALTIAFLYTGATNLVATAQEKDRDDEEKSQTTKSFATAIQLSGYVGAALGCVLFVFARQLINTLTGTGSINEEVFNTALKYVRIRALGMPAAAIIGSAQSGCLGMQDVKSPLYVLGAAALINLLGDIFLVGLKTPWFGGAAGAAWATILSQYAAVGLFVKWLCTKPKSAPKKSVNVSDAIMELTGDDNDKGKGRRKNFNRALKSLARESSEGSLATKVASVTHKLQTKKTETKKKTCSTRGLLSGKFKGVDLFKFPSLIRAKEYAPFVVPVTTTQIGRVSAYLAMSHVVSSSLGLAAMAAQQILVSIFYCLTPLSDSLSLTAQSIVPTLSEKLPSKGRAKALRNTLRNFLKAGVIYGGVMMSAALCIPFISRIFTADQYVISLVNSVVPLLVAVFGMDNILMASEGFLLGQKDLNFIGKMYASFFVAVPYFMLRVKRAALAGNPAINLTSVWSVFVTYQFVRFAVLLVRALMVQRRTELEVSKEAA
mmetsp:Transcript_18492/g.28050  ORF Transcript_18492/g.28050 Transcript_18492/m.28050 type:complete len:721 (+) Transcript_18492:83-2245(+)